LISNSACVMFAAKRAQPGSVRATEARASYATVNTRVGRSATIQAREG
jgi:hypothetical protein